MTFSCSYNIFQGSQRKTKRKKCNGVLLSESKKMLVKIEVLVIGVQFLYSVVQTLDSRISKD